MKPIQKGLAIIAGATLITVLAITFLGEGSKKGEQKDVVETDAKVEAKETQENSATDLGATNAVETNAATVEGQGEASSVATTEASSTSSPVAASAETESAKDVQNAAQVQTEVAATSDAPAPPGPFHKNTLAGTPEMPAAPAAPTSENVDLPPPPMPQALIDAPASPAAPEVNISKPEFVVTKPEMNVAAPEQPAAEVASPEAPANLAQDVKVEAVVPTEEVANPAEQSKKSEQEAQVVVEAETQSVEVEAVAEPVTEGVSSTEATVSIPAAPVAMPEKPTAPMVPAEIQQNRVNVQGQQMQQQPRVIFVPVPVYPYQQPNMNQQWGAQAPQMNVIPPQPPVMGETAPAQGQ